jgi:hypothetical protein
MHGRAPTSYLEGVIVAESDLNKQHLQQRSTLFCVLDEAQVLTKSLDYFQSSADSTKGRPILRAILSSRSRGLPNLIVLGTGISMTEVQNVIGSVVAKERGGPETVTEIGGFDDESGQQAYLEQYLPPGFLDTPLGKEIASRVGYWLRGRFVFNAAV